jgi:DNA-binding MarR family transcriptional regulator
LLGQTLLIRQHNSSCNFGRGLAALRDMALPSVWHAFGRDHLPYRLLLLARMIDRRSTRELQKIELSLAEWRVLAFIGVTGPASASEIGKFGEIDRAEISRAVGKLEDKGLIERHPDQSHRKRFIISPTPMGESLFREVREERRRFFKSMTEGLSQSERKLIDSGLEKMALNLLQD